MTKAERNRLKRLRKQRANPKPKGRHTDIPLHAIEATRIRFNLPNGMPGGLPVEVTW
jgi:hypothetical protein